jgi:hypothetical protein
MFSDLKKKNENAVVEMAENGKVVLVIIFRWGKHA